MVASTCTLGMDGRLANAEKRVGVGNFCAELLRALPECAEGLSLRVYLDAPPRPGFPVSPEEAELCVLPPGRFWTHRVLRKALWENPPEVFLSPVFQLPWRCPCPGIATVHDLAFLDFGEQFTWRRRTLARWQARDTVRRAAHLLAVSQATRDDLMRRYAVPAERVTVTNEAASARFSPVTEAAVLRGVRERHGLPEQFVLYVGRIQPRKNLVRLMAAFADVLGRHPELPHHLVIAGGKGWMFEPIYEAAEHSPVRERIRFLDHVPDADLPALMSLAEVLALVSLWEGFGLPVLEAMQCGTAVLTSDCSSLPEVAGDAAALVDPREAGAIAAGLERLLCDEAYRKMLEKRALARAARYSWGDTARRVVEAVNRVRQARR